MKKLFSLLLALTMVLSLVVVPARATVAATDISTSGTTTVAKGSTTTITATAPTSTESKTYAELITEGYTQSAETWSWSTSNNNISLQNQSTAAVTVKGISAGNATITCNYTTSFSKDADTIRVEKATNVNIVVSDALLASDIKSVKFHTRECFNGSSVNVALLDGETLSDAGAWTIEAKDSEQYSNISATVSGNKLNLTANSSSVSGSLDISSSKALSLNVVPSDGKISKDSSATVTASLSSSVISSGVIPTYAWTQKESGAASTTTITGATGSSLVFSGAVYPAGTYTITCTATIGEKTATETVTIVNDGKNYDIRPTSNPKEITLSTVYASSDSASSFPAIGLYDVSTPTSPVAVSPAVSFSYEKVSDPNNAVNLNTSNGTFTVTGNGVATLRAQTIYNGKTYTKDVVVYASALMADFDRQVWYNNPGTYYYSDLVTAADKAFSAASTYGASYGTVSSIQSVTVSNFYNGVALGTSTNTLSGGAQSGAITFTAYYNTRGKAPVTVRLITTTGRTVTVTLNIPVVPTPVTFDSIAAEPVTSSYNSTVTSYRVTFPSTYSTYYVIQKNGTTAPDYATASLVGNAYSSATPYTLTAADFGTNGQCTLYVIATNNYNSSSYGMYYSGTITVTQTNHDIKYNGVVGGTVQFAHNDFTTFMNEMYGTNTTSYLTFNSVKFTSVPNATTQGTLYYNGVAMTTGYGSNYFNTSTAVTNLDNVSFSVSSQVPSATKEIRIPFTLYATRYNSYGTSAGTSVTYSGVVVISLVREDVTFTVAPGDSVRFTDSAFLTYLRSASGTNYNYNIDYVTFDQSAVNALNEGVLYAYSTGFNAVKTTDKFYYTTTSYNQNALSDVTFRASTYAKAGTTVYIPFTIYAKYGTSSATKQVTGTVAIKIAQTMNFVDVKTSDYFYDSVKWAVNNNITKGTSTTTFSPNNTCTRAEIVTFLWRDAGSPTPTITRNPFTDVKYPVGSDFYNAILWASQNGITAGKTATTFAPNDNCTRAQIVTFLWRYAKKPLGYYTNPFNDVNKTEHASYYDAILWAAGKGIATGNTPKTFNPDGTCTRAEAVTFLYRYESTK